MFVSLNISFLPSKMRCLDWTISTVLALLWALPCINLLPKPHFTDRPRAKTAKARGLQKSYGSS